MAEKDKSRRQPLDSSERVLVAGVLAGAGLAVAGLALGAYGIATSPRNSLQANLFGAEMFGSMFAGVGAALGGVRWAVAIDDRQPEYPQTSDTDPICTLPRIPAAGEAWQEQETQVMVAGHILHIISLDV